ARAAPSFSARSRSLFIDFSMRSVDFLTCSSPSLSLRVSARISTERAPRLTVAIGLLVDLCHLVLGQGAIHLHRTMSLHQPPEFARVQRPELRRRYPAAADCRLVR